jgi:uncharacterized membrane protein YcaP (DUF421 family)
MDSIIRGTVVYIVLLVLFRIAGKRSLAEITAFDLVLLLIISEATQDALIDNDNSMTNAFLVIVTLIAMNVLFSLLSHRWKLFDKLTEGVPMIIAQDGRLLADRMGKERISEEEVLEAAREFHGLETLGEVKYAILERNGKITIIPKSSGT